MGKLELSKMLISKKNEVNLRLTDVEPSVAAELNDFFTFEVPGFKYMPAYRKTRRNTNTHIKTDRQIYIHIDEQTDK